MPTLNGNIKRGRKKPPARTFVGSRNFVRKRNKTKEPEPSVETVKTVVEYTDKKQAGIVARKDGFFRIISPTHPGPCCSTHTEPIGELQREYDYEFVVVRCKRCGYTTKKILRPIPNEALLAEVRKDIANFGSRSWQRIYDLPGSCNTPLPTRFRY